MSIGYRDVKRVVCNWYFTEDGENYTTFVAGKENVLSIKYHCQTSEIDRHYVDITFDDMSVIRHFNINSILFD